MSVERNVKMSGECNNVVARNVSIDIARIFFAFLVVVIHVPIHGRTVVQPFARIAVPFFYMVTGYFLLGNNNNIGYNKLKNSLKKYNLLWLRYFVLLTTIIYLLRYIYKDYVPWTNDDVIRQLFLSGNCRAAERITINGITYGCSTLWFLYGGIISLFLMYLVRKYINTVYFIVFVTLIWLSFIILNYDGIMRFPRLLGVSLPYLFAGYLIRKYENDLVHRRSMKVVLYLLGVSVFLMYLEAFFFRAGGYTRLFLLPSSVFAFILILKTEITASGGGQIVENYNTQDDSRYLCMAQAYILYPFWGVWY